MSKNVKVTQDENNVVELEILAKAIKDVADGMEKLLKTPLKRKTLILLIHDAIPSKSGVRKSDIDWILDSIKDLKKNHLK